MHVKKKLILLNKYIQILNQLILNVFTMEAKKNVGHARQKDRRKKRTFT
jgi:hypothetical protein